MSSPNGKTSAQLIREDILGLEIEDLAERPFFAPRWGPIDPTTGQRTGRWFVARELTGEERAIVMNAMFKRQPGQTQTTQDLKALYTLAVVLGCREAIPAPGDDPLHPASPEQMRGGERIFNLTDQNVIARRSGATLEGLGQLVMQMSGLDDASLEEAKKNSSPAVVESNASILSLPNTSDSLTPIS